MTEREKRIVAMESTLRAYRTEKANPEVLQGTMDFHKERIAFHKRQLEILEARMNDSSHIEIMKNSIKLAKQELRVEKAERYINSSIGVKRDKKTLMSIYEELKKEFD